MKDLYAILGCCVSDDGKAIKRCFHQKALKCHPDKYPGDAKCHTAFVELKDAYEILGDPKQRQQYDEEYLRDKQQQYKRDGPFSPPSPAQDDFVATYANIINSLDDDEDDYDDSDEEQGYWGSSAFAFMNGGNGDADNSGGGGGGFDYWNSWQPPASGRTRSARQSAEGNGNPQQQQKKKKNGDSFLEEFLCKPHRPKAKSDPLLDEFLLHHEEVERRKKRMAQMWEDLFNDKRHAPPLSRPTSQQSSFASARNARASTPATGGGGRRSSVGAKPDGPGASFTLPSNVGSRPQSRQRAETFPTPVRTSTKEEVKPVPTAQPSVSTSSSSSFATGLSSSSSQFRAQTAPESVRRPPLSSSTSFSMPRATNGGSGEQQHRRPPPAPPAPTAASSSGLGLGSEWESSFRGGHFKTLDEREKDDLDAEEEEEEEVMAEDPFANADNYNNTIPITTYASTSSTFSSLPSTRPSSSFIPPVYGNRSRPSSQRSSSRPSSRAPPFVSTLASELSEAFGASAAAGTGGLNNYLPEMLTSVNLPSPTADSLLSTLTARTVEPLPRPEFNCLSSALHASNGTSVPSARKKSIPQDELTSHVPRAAEDPSSPSSSPTTLGAPSTSSPPSSSASSHRSTPPLGSNSQQQQQPPAPTSVAQKPTTAAPTASSTATGLPSVAANNGFHRGASFSRTLLAAASSAPSSARQLLGTPKGVGQPSTNRGANSSWRRRGVPVSLCTVAEFQATTTTITQSGTTPGPTRASSSHGLGAPPPPPPNKHSEASATTAMMLGAFPCNVAPSTGKGFLHHLALQGKQCPLATGNKAPRHGVDRNSSVQSSRSPPASTATGNAVSAAAVTATVVSRKPKSHFGYLSTPGSTAKSVAGRTD